MCSICCLMQSVCFFKKIPNLLGSWHRVMLAWEITSLGWDVWLTVHTANGDAIVRIPATVSSAGPGETPQTAILHSSCSPAGRSPTWPAIDYLKLWAKHPLTIFTMCRRLFYITVSASAGTISTEYLEGAHQCLSSSVLQQVLPGAVPSMAIFSILDANTLAHQIVSIKWSKHSRSCLVEPLGVPKIPARAPT